MEEAEGTGLTWREAYAALEQGVARFVGEASATAALVVREDGQLLTWAGGLRDPSALGALAAGSMAAGEALLGRAGDRGRYSLSLDGQDQGFYLTVVEAGAFLVVMFDRRCSLGLVRLRARQLVERAGPWLSGLRRVEADLLDALDDDDLASLFADVELP